MYLISACITGHFGPVLKRGEKLFLMIFFCYRLFLMRSTHFYQSNQKMTTCTHFADKKNLSFSYLHFTHLFSVDATLFKKNAHENIRSILSCFGHCKCCSKTLLQSSTQMNLVFLCIHAFSQKWAVALKSLQLFCLKMKHDSGAY